MQHLGHKNVFWMFHCTTPVFFFSQIVGVFFHQVLLSILSIVHPLCINHHLCSYHSQIFIASSEGVFIFETPFTITPVMHIHRIFVQLFLFANAKRGSLLTKLTVSELASQWRETQLESVRMLISLFATRGISKGVSGREMPHHISVSNLSPTWPTVNNSPIFPGRVIYTHTHMRAQNANTLTSDYAPTV